MSGNASETGQSTETDAEHDIIDVEVIEASEASKTSTAENAGPTPKKKKPWGWITTCILAVFITGIFTAPYANEGLAKLGLSPSNAIVENSASGSDAETRSLIADLRADIDRLTAFTGQQESLIQGISSNLETTKTSLAALSTELTSDTVTGAETNTNSAALDQLRADVTRLSEDITRLATLSGNNAPSTSRIDSALAVNSAETQSLKERITILESALEAVEAGRLESSPRGRLILLLSQIKDKALSGLSFKADLEGLRADLSTLPALDQQLVGSDLVTLEQTGGLLTPFDQLLSSFEDVATQITHAQEKSDGSFLQSLFTVRRRDAGATGVDAVLYDTEKRLLVRDIAGAIDRLETLEGDALEAASIWLQQAKSHVGARQAFDRLISRISGRAGG